MEICKGKTKDEKKLNFDEKELLEICLRIT